MLTFVWLLAASPALAQPAAASRARVPASARGITAAGRLPVLGRVPDFTLRDSRGRPFGRRDLLGKPWVAAFIFTRCAGQCPVMTARMRALHKRLPGLALVSISVDPRDTPARLSGYKRRHGADWVFLTGTRDAVRRLSVDGFRLPVAEGGSPKEAIVHSDKLVLVDASGAIRGYFDGLDRGSVGRLAREAASL